MVQHFPSKKLNGESSFKKVPLYNEFGDCIDYRTSGETAYRDRLNSLITLYRSMEDDRVIGFQIKGVTALLRRLGCNVLKIVTAGTKADNSIPLIAVLFCAIQESKEKAPLKKLQELAPLAHKIPLNQKIPYKSAA
ncbi:MAG TPA: hypothetical protein VM223_00825 [Planctomycetota bacterium]|nr:hypothetical protein [Planctomycetota bacterium]